MSERDRPGARRLRDDEHVKARNGRGLRRIGAPCRTLRKRLEIFGHALDEPAGNVPRKAQRQRVAREPCRVKRRGVFPPQRVDTANGPLDGAAVGVPRVEEPGQRFDAEPLVVAGAQSGHERVALVISQALELLLVETRLEHDLANEVVVPVEMIAMDRALDDGDLAIDVDADPSGHRIQSIEQLFVRQRPRAPLGEQRAGRGGEPFLPGGIVDASGCEQQPDRNERGFVRREEDRLHAGPAASPGASVTTVRFVG